MSDPEHDSRFSVHLLVEIRAVLKKHGYLESTKATSHADVVADLLRLTRAYEGRAS